MKKRILVDLSATILHHGHIRLLKKASKFGEVWVALTSDKEIKKIKGYKPELNFNQRKEILESIKFVNKVIKSKWLIDEKFLKKNKIFKLVHGNDNSNSIDKQRLIIFNRTKGISSTTIRKRSRKILRKINK
ncbi:adenylyltransferase/cytidyltransferase family protein [Candidatus Pelagibacter communis]|uniref:adenylyltransferase/cytidyltransferase family protein n=1 Tax=Pelagibacter ubique TaxID=198252 RepID=UPI001C52AFA5|nr:adenylyltransferase/cytidyltransferase family protein [Candidatus Pelagibacter ubique]